MGLIETLPLRLCFATIRPPDIKFQPGVSTILVSLANIENIQQISFLNDGAQGDLTVSTSNADVPDSSPQWQRVAQSCHVTGSRLDQDWSGGSEIRSTES